MPFISLKTNVKIDEKKEISLKERLGESIGIIPGKSEAWLMLDFEGDCRMYFKGSDSPLAFFEVKIFGGISENTANVFTETLCRLAEEELGVEKSRVYVKYEETKYWGWNGANF